MITGELMVSIIFWVCLLGSIALFFYDGSRIWERTPIWVDRLVIRLSYVLTLGWIVAVILMMAGV